MSQAPVIPPQSAIGDRPSAIHSLSLFARDIKISHTLFALPWAVLATFLAGRTLPGGLPTIPQILLILGCMVTARTVAMSANRLLDARLDAANPRTAKRAIPSGALSVRFYLAVLLACALAFILLTSGFWLLASNPWPLILSLPVLLFISAYPLLKRFTRLCHYYLGAALALAPVCAYLAVAGRLDWPPVIMAAAVLLWTAGFDIIYACQDYQSDKETGVFSVPAKIGIGPALWVARLTHACCAALLILLGFASPWFSTLYFIGAAVAIALLIVEHALVRADDLSKVGLAFFTINGVISVLVATLGVIDLFV
jgi:4-hydroxybenzoate polyprenyltransferase